MKDTVFVVQQWGRNPFELQRITVDYGPWWKRWWRGRYRRYVVVYEVPMWPYAPPRRSR